MTLLENLENQNSLDMKSQQQQPDSAYDEIVGTSRILKESRIFAPYRILGHIANHVPFSLQTRGSEYFLTTSIGRAFHIYNVEKFDLLFVSKTTDEPIVAIESQGDITFTGCGTDVWLWNRAKCFGKLMGPRGKAVKTLMVFGEYLIVVHEGGCLRVWEHKNQEIYLEQTLNFEISCILHPSTYLNKVLVASMEGFMQLWNLKTNELIYQFESYSQPITALAQSTAVDIVGIGLLDGSIHLRNLKYDKTLFSFHQDDKVTALTFRTDGETILASANTRGEIACWDLDKKKLVHLIRDAHEGYIGSMAFLPGQALLVSSGTDNALREWVFDGSEGSARLLKSRSGHSTPPNLVRYYGTSGHDLLSSGSDRSLRFFSLLRDSQNCELSQGSLIKKAKTLMKSVEELRYPLITQFTGNETKKNEWESVISCHLNENHAHTWRFDKKAVGKHTLISSDGSLVKSVSISSCGHYGLIGCSSGRIDMFNLQSGIHRRTFHGSKGHQKSVTAICVDSLNRFLISGSLDGSLKIWNFNNATLNHTISLEEPISHVILHRENDLVAVVSDDLSIRVLDLDTRQWVRHFIGHWSRITDLCFSPDARWLISASLDSTVRVWDLPSGRMIDWFKVDSLVTSLSFSPTGNFLASTHVDHLGIFLWSNQTQFKPVILTPIPEEEPYLFELERIETLEKEEMNEIQDETNLIEDYKSLEQLHESMVTLSNLPKSKWEILLNLETIKERNKPKEPPKAPEKAPFFLPTISAALPTFSHLSNQSSIASSLEPAPNSRLIQSDMTFVERDFQKILRNCASNNHFEELLLLIKEMSPSQIDAELRLLPIHEDFGYFRGFLEFLTDGLENCKNFEIMESCLSVFLRIHGLSIYQTTELRGSLQRILDVHQTRWKRLSDMSHYASYLLEYCKQRNF